MFVFYAECLTDIDGTVKKMLEVLFSQLNKALNNEMMFDGSSELMVVRIEESDIYYIQI